MFESLLGGATGNDVVAAPHVRLWLYLRTALQSRAQVIDIAFVPEKNENEKRRREREVRAAFVVLIGESNERIF